MYVSFEHMVGDDDDDDDDGRAQERSSGLELP